MNDLNAVREQLVLANLRTDCSERDTARARLAVHWVPHLVSEIEQLRKVARVAQDAAELIYDPCDGKTQPLLEIIAEVAKL